MYWTRWWGGERQDGAGEEQGGINSVVSFPFTGKQECSYDVDLQPPRAVVGQGLETKVTGSPMR